MIISTEYKQSANEWDNNVNSKKIYQNFSFLLIANAILLILLIHILPVRFETNDDVMMLLIGSGIYSGSPDAHLVFINYIYGSLVSFLYTHFPGIEWYTVLMISIHILSISIISWKILGSNTSLIRKVIYLFIFYCIEINLIVYLQFTTTASLCALSGIILFVSDNLSKKILALLIFTLASLIRFESVFLILIINIPFGVYFLIKRFQSKSYSCILLLPMFFILPVLGKIIDNRIYSNETKWSTYKEYNDYRGRINDNPNAESFNDLPANITQSDYVLFLSFFADTNVFDNETVKLLYSKIKGVNFENKLKNIPSNLYVHRRLIFLIFLLAIIQILFIKEKVNRLILISTTILFFFLLIYISLEAILKFRVFISMIMAFCWILFITGYNILNKRFKYLYILVLFLFSFYLIRHSVREYRHDKRIISKTIEQQKYLLSNLKPSDGYIIAFGASLSPEFLPPFNISKFYSEHRFLGLGWMAKIPFNEGKLDSFLDFVDKNAVYTNRYNFDKAFPLIKHSIYTHYDLDVHYDIICETDEYLIYRLTSIHE